MKTIVLIVCCFSLLATGLFACTSEPAKTPEEKNQANAADLRQTLQDAVKDSGRLQQMLALADQFEIELQTGMTEFAKLHQEQQQLNADYTATREAFQQLGEHLQQVRTEYRSKMITTRMAIAQLATDDEWKKITSRELALFGN